MQSKIGFGGERAVFAVQPQTSRGRLYPEAGSPTRTPYQRDRDRIIHSTAFRRLKDKTQVFLYDEGDHYRTRLTHTIEVAQIARALARALRLDEDLAEAIALAHDLGHPPFGHAGERALDAVMADCGGFDHNAQSLRVVTRLERRYPGFDGLNLSWETLEGLVKHNGPLVDAEGSGVGVYAGRPLPLALTAYAELQDLELSTFSSAEAQAAAIADDIAYDAHDIDDGLRAGLLSAAGLREVPFLDDIMAAIEAEHPRLEQPRLVNEIVRRLITRMIEDVISQSIARIETLNPHDADDIRHAPHAVIAFSEAVAIGDREIKRYLKKNVYRHEKIMSVMRSAEDIVRRLFERYWRDPGALPEEWRLACEGVGEARRARAIADFLAGMTDRYAIREYQRLFDASADLG
ncbi:deoxyguanosinetriphosphate triphosphohydrolase [Kaistia algarum]|uniref:deoxyguanosinetriphosphate triphosphohydrolase n=1 Tax=Kaistia algarum TaxID=2083279 RepID=UPI000CE74253|nr:deoxyguanosinetriphosphate triphosphohydrolase [Kaistia algarum]MCX5515140.1 deoxyguanosinetriphosphate triphosphohydrolase [Kaistia algarum]PPE80009.1 deoxyguanosinetriphosphate triphosphohydrolase [Kaistia algarum]